MSFIVNYQFSERFETRNDVDFETADEMTLRYDLFLGSVTLIGDQSNIPMDWEWIPLLDFAVALNDARECLKLVEIGTEQLDFTESEALLLFNKSDRRIQVSTSYSDESIVVFHEDFELGVARFLHQLTKELLIECPTIENNTFFRDGLLAVVSA